jgi:hypothetical protein
MGGRGRESFLFLLLVLVLSGQGNFSERAAEAGMSVEGEVVSGER